MSVTAEGQQAIADAIREHCRPLGLSLNASQSCVDLGRVLNIYGADQAESIRRASQMADVIAREVHDARFPLTRWTRG